LTPAGSVFCPSDLSGAAREEIVARAIELKQLDPHPVPNRLRVGALYFNPSLRTRASFEQAVRVVGGAC
jgi:ornithine carbamoyltransferase